MQLIHGLTIIFEMFLERQEQQYRSINNITVSKKKQNDINHKKNVMFKRIIIIHSK